MESYVVGVDIGGTGTKFGIVDKDGNVLKPYRTLKTNFRHCVYIGLSP